MKRFALGLLAIGGALVFTNSAQAGAVSELVPNEINRLEDENFEQFFNKEGTSTQINVGDVFLGVIRIQEIFAPPGTSVYDPGANEPTLTGLFLIQAAAIVNQSGGTSPDGIDNTIVYFKPVGTTDWSMVTGLTLPSPTNANTILQVWDDVTSAELLRIGVNLQTSVDSFIGTNKVYELGFAGGDFASDGVSDLGEFFLAHGALGTDTVGANLLTIRNLLNLNMLANFNGAPDLVPHTHLSTTAFQGPAVDAGVSFGSAADLQGEGTIDTGNGDPWAFSTDTDSFIKPVPEPGSLTLLALGAMGVGGFGYRRRARKLAA